jgi:ribosome recycling factor
MKNLMMIAGIVFALGACKNDFDKAMSEAESLTDKMCACKNEACADKVRDQRREARKKFKDALKGKEPSEDQLKRAMKIDEKWRTCSDKIASS